jgi:hypothetical protein
LPLVDIFDESDAEEEDYIPWTRCWIACNALFLSDITKADGKNIDKRYLSDSVIGD